MANSYSYRPLCASLRFAPSGTLFLSLSHLMRWFLLRARIVCTHHQHHQHHDHIHRYLHGQYTAWLDFARLQCQSECVCCSSLWLGSSNRSNEFIVCFAYWLAFFGLAMRSHSFDSFDLDANGQSTSSQEREKERETRVLAQYDTHGAVAAYRTMHSNHQLQFDGWLMIVLNLAPQPNHII